MRYEQFAAELPPQRTMVFASAEENEETMQRLGVNQRVRQLGKGAFQCHVAARSTADAEFFADRFNKAAAMYVEPPADTVGLMFPLSATGKFLVAGENVAGGKLLVFSKDSGIDMVTGDLAGSEDIAIPAARFAELTHVLCRMRQPVHPERLTIYSGNTTQLRALRQAVVDLMTAPEPEPDREQVANLLVAAITWIAASSGHEAPERLTARCAHASVARQAQEFIEAHYREAVSVEDLCHVTGVSARTLQRSFREYFDLTITNYLKTVRLDACHRRLAAASYAETTVSAISMESGFTHLGRFSAEYRRRFGLSARDSLIRRSTGAIRIDGSRLYN
jgi:AraC-like DNA-binding protein